MFETIKNEKLVLSRFKLTDSEQIFDALIASRKEISPWLSWLTPTYSLKSAKDFVTLQIDNWNKNIEYTYSVKNKKGDFLGVVSLQMFDTQNDVASIGYWMNTQFTNKGYCTEALKLLISQAFIPLNLIRVEIIVAIENKASQQVAIKSGATFEAILKNRLRIKGVASDAKIYTFTNANQIT